MIVPLLYLLFLHLEQLKPENAQMVQFAKTDVREHGIHSNLQFSVTPVSPKIHLLAESCLIRTGFCLK